MKKLTLEEFILKANNKYKNKFDYSKSIYTNSHLKIKIICPIHGVFDQSPNDHLTKKYGCTSCSPTGGKLLTKNQFIKKCIKKHGNKYDYSKTIFTGVKNKIIIICKIHGEFSQLAGHHFNYGCSACAGNKKISKKEFLQKSNLIHNNYYDYSLINLFFATEKIIIICPKHGKFEQLAGSHLKGRKCFRCAKGNTSILEHKWLDSVGLPNDKDHRNVKLQINNKSFNVDGYMNNIIYEFLGDYWHGNPSIYKNNEYNKSCKKKFYELFQKTVDRIRFFRKNGFKVISIWEKDFIKKWKKY